MIGKHAWQAQILDVIRYVLLLQHPSDLEEVTSRENANLSAIKYKKTGIVPREIASVSLGCPGPRFGSDNFLISNIKWHARRYVLAFLSCCYGHVFGFVRV